MIGAADTHVTGITKRGEEVTILKKRRMGVLNRTPAPIDTDRPAAADFVRVLATWAVATFHIWQQSWYGGAAPAHWLRAGSVGVDLLVMLSAFCLFLPWANAAAQGRPLPLTRPAAFYRRRAAAAARLLRQPAVQPCADPVPRRVEPHAGHRPGRPPGADPAAVSAELSCHLAQRRDLDADGVCAILPCVPAAGPALCQTPAADTGCALRRAAGLYAVGAAAVRQRRLFLAVQSVPCVLRRAGWGWRRHWCLHGWPAAAGRSGFTPRGLYGARCFGAGVAQCAAAHTRRMRRSSSGTSWSTRIPLALAAAAVLVCFGLGLTLPRPVRRALAWLSALTYSFICGTSSLPYF